MQKAQAAIIFKASSRSVRGFTLIEMLVVLLLGALLTATVLPAMQRMNEAAQYKTARDSLVGRLGELAYEAFASGRSVVLTSSNAAATPGLPGHGADAPPPYPLEVPEGWVIEVEHPIKFAFNGICEGGTVTLRPPGRPPEKLVLAAPLCKAVPGGA